MAKPRMSLSQTSLFSRDDDVLAGSIRELASHHRVLRFIEGTMNDYTPSDSNLLLIPESRRKPFTKSQLYRNVKNFLKDQSFDQKYHVVFISNVLGVCPEELAVKEVANFELIGSMPDNSVIRRTASILARYLEKTMHDYTKRLVYARGSYLESVKLASELSGINVESILTQGDLIWLKRLGIKWMKIGLRMPECLTIFKKRIAEMTNNKYPQAKISEFQ
ncbi:MAG: DUF5591 domain-containing protein [Candidatus Thermoplasmatota archaeon]|nr:DUF5591 domain-containing protein [Candidatus Thermoplasmatota archaeon]MCG2826723.1 DUF5591 domain-containing protein [Thermoplasmatales archaeon]